MTCFVLIYIDANYYLNYSNNVTAAVLNALSNLAIRELDLTLWCQSPKTCIVLIWYIDASYFSSLQKLSGYSNVFYFQISTLSSYRTTRQDIGMSEHFHNQTYPETMRVVWYGSLWVQIWENRPEVYIVISVSTTQHIREWKWDP